MVAHRTREFHRYRKFLPQLSQRHTYLLQFEKGTLHVVAKFRNNTLFVVANWRDGTYQPDANLAMWWCYCITLHPFYLYTESNCACTFIFELSVQVTCIFNLLWWCNI